MLHLIPTPIAENNLLYVHPQMHQTITSIKIWCVEELRTARRFLKAVNREINIDELTFFVVNKQQLVDEEKIAKYLQSKQDVGLLSEAGCPAVADPGSSVVALAHKHKVPVMPHVGPNSILLALMGSGMNGQRFQFLGYIPIKNPERTAQIKALEAESAAKRCTQIFIETPYRNLSLLEELIKHCNPQTRLCVAANLQMENQIIVSQTIAKWRQQPELPIHKIPTVFCLLAE